MIYSPEKLAATVEKLSKLYDLKKPEDLFMILPQLMEQVEVRAMAYEVKGGSAKKQAVMDVLLGIAKQNSIKLNKKLLSVFIDVIIDSSKGRYAFNKEQS
jgi:hypothetical protein